MKNEKKIKDLKVKTIFEEIQKDMDEFFAEMDKIVYPNKEKK
jgi:hypothetical protein|tara:strand:- start:831 stop:956 length:126 start_codon:yes stop_codon:yes gene_type:complete